jgi:hypothetical protein
MKRNRFISAAVVAVTAMALLGATEALAAKGPLSASFSEKGSKHYDWTVFGGEQGVSVSASGHDGFANYSTKGTVSKKKIKATFKGFGKVKMKFHPKGKADHVGPPKGCTGPDTIVQDGTWKGKFTFKGEDGYSKVSTKSAKGSVSQTESTKPIECNGGGGPGGNGKKCVILSSFEKNDFFQAQQIKGQKDPSFTVSSSDKKKGLSISRSAFVSGGSFDYDVDAQTATIKPPSPFSGTGNYANNQLKGSLKVKLPGDTISVGGDASLSDGKCF